MFFNRHLSGFIFLKASGCGIIFSFITAKLKNKIPEIRTLNPDFRKKLKKPEM
ncbi:MAG: hypothetical protein U5L07_17785 [Desulfobacterales bacterium]|nr:hypothetical protein [Desulfobacterales bacterium]